MFTKRKLFYLAILIVSIIPISKVGIAKGINILDPSFWVGNLNDVHMPMVHPLPEDMVTYDDFPVGDRINAPESLQGRAFAQLTEVPEGFRKELKVYFTSNLEWNLDPDYPVAYKPLANILYKGDRGTLYLTTTLPSPAAENKRMVFGDRVNLPGDVTGWVTHSPPQDEIHHRILFVREGTLVTLGGNLPLEEMKALTGKIVFE